MRKSKQAPTRPPMRPPTRFYVCVEDSGYVESATTTREGHWPLDPRIEPEWYPRAFLRRKDAASFAQDVSREYADMPPLRVATYALVDEKPATKKARKR